MFQLVKGAFIPNISGLREEYEVDGDKVCANVSAEKISKVFESFLNEMKEDEPLFLFVEVPCSEEDELKFILCSQSRKKLSRNTTEMYII